MERFFDPDLWQAHYLQNFLSVIDAETVSVFNEADMLMTLQILANLKKEAPWLYEEVGTSRLNLLADHYFNQVKEQRVESVAKQHMYAQKDNKGINFFENQVTDLLKNNIWLKQRDIKVSTEVCSGLQSFDMILSWTSQDQS